MVTDKSPFMRNFSVTMVADTARKLKETILGYLIFQQNDRQKEERKPLFKGFF
jgi:hypothetical protein